MDANEKNRRRPPWLKVPAFGGDKYHRIRQRLRGLTLHTVCEEANCPNRGECFNSGTATFLLMGPICSRNCRFCNISGGIPQPVDIEEPKHLAQLAAELKLRHVVITSVTRDDLPDQGAGQFCAAVEEVRKLLSKASIEILTPDFGGRRELLDLALEERPDIFNHNVETVPRLYPLVRPQADFQRSLDVLAYVAKTYPDIRTKSGLMVGLGEEICELDSVFEQLHLAGVEILTMGQYLSPTKDHYPIVRYYTPDEFTTLRDMALARGIKTVVSGPLVRSSYRAGSLV